MDVGKVRVSGLQEVLAVLETQRLDGHLAIDDGHDDVTGLGGRIRLHADQVAIEQACVAHGVAANGDEASPVGVVDKVVVQREDVLLLLNLGLRLWQARADRAPDGPGEELAGRRNAPLVSFQLARIDQPPDQLEHRAGVG